MKRTLLTVGAALVLLPLFSAQTHANSQRTPGSAETTVLLRCRETRSSDRSFYETEQLENHTFSSRTSSSHLTDNYRVSSRSQIREILRRHEIDYAASTPVVIEIQGDCDAIRVEINAEHLPDELFPGEFDRLDGYEEWREEILRGQHSEPLEDLSPWLTRTGSGWDWLVRRRGSADEHAAQSVSCMCVQAPCHCAYYFSP